MKRFLRCLNGDGIEQANGLAVIKPEQPSSTRSTKPNSACLYPMKRTRLKPLTKTLFVGGALIAGVSLAPAQDAGRMEKLEQENQQLRKRLDALESVMQKEGLTSTATQSPKPVSALSNTTLSGFVTTSYF